MSENLDDPRGSAPAMTTKDVILRIYDSVETMRPQVAVLVSQNLNERVTKLETLTSNSAAGDRRMKVIDTTIRGWVSTAVAIVAAVVATIALVSR